MHRRRFLTDAGLISTAVLGGTSAFSRLNGEDAPTVPTGLRILFQGDSITDAGRNRGNYYANADSGMGGGYVYQIAADLLGGNPEANLQCFNRGISGHKVFQLADRWDLDCLALKPDVLSILIGVNDYWHMLGGRYDGSVAVYEGDFAELLEQTKKALPEVQLMIGEPFAVAGGTAIDDQWDAFDGYRAAAERVAKEFDAAFIPYHQIFADALAHAPADYWCPDGVHPSMAGAHLMKEAWLKEFERLMKS
ncbi:MAG: SGNH/GDSL hydrolase family protein [Saprospiraceae bacterium]|nr:SGNH/GDSL hydrolase family protein [Saprospiraceae bacterium]